MKTCKTFSQAYLLFNLLVINALQNLLFCVLKAQVLHGKSGCFALQKSRFRNVKAQLSFFKVIIFTKQMWFSQFLIQAGKEINTIQGIDCSRICTKAETKKEERQAAVSSSLYKLFYACFTSLKPFLPCRLPTSRCSDRVVIPLFACPQWCKQPLRLFPRQN